MAQNRTGYRVIDDGEVDAESPITQSLMFALRDQWAGGVSTDRGSNTNEKLLLPQNATTSNLATGQYLRTNGAGGFELGALPTGGAPAEFTTGAASSISTSKTSLTTITQTDIATTARMTNVTWQLNFTGVEHSIKAVKPYNSNDFILHGINGTNHASGTNSCNVNGTVFYLDRLNDNQIEVSAGGISTTVWWVIQFTSYAP